MSMIRADVAVLLIIEQNDMQPTADSVTCKDMPELYRHTLDVELTLVSVISLYLL